MLSSAIAAYRIKGMGHSDIIWYRVTWDDGSAASYGRKPSGAWVEDDFTPVTSDQARHLATIPEPRRQVVTRA